MTEKMFKVTVCFEARPDGGLRVYSEDVPGLVLSHTDVDGVLEDVKTAIETLLSHRYGGTFVVNPLPNLRDALEADGIVQPKMPTPGPKEYVATLH